MVEIAGHLYVEAPKNRKMRRTIYPWATPAATRSPPGSPTASSRPALSNGPAPTRSADLSLPDQKALAVLQLQPQRPAARLPGRRMARRARQRRLDLAQPAARVLHHRLLARHQIAIARFGTDVAAADGIGPALAAGLDPAGYPVVPGGVPQAWERAQVYLGLCERYQELYQAQVAELHLLMASHRHGVSTIAG